MNDKRRIHKHTMYDDDNTNDDNGAEDDVHENENKNVYDVCEIQTLLIFTVTQTLINNYIRKNYSFYFFNPL